MRKRRWRWRWWGRPKEEELPFFVIDGGFFWRAEGSTEPRIVIGGVNFREGSSFSHNVIWHRPRWWQLRRWYKALRMWLALPVIDLEGRLPE